MGEATGFWEMRVGRARCVLVEEWLRGGRLGVGEARMRVLAGGWRWRWLAIEHYLSRFNYIVRVI